MLAFAILYDFSAFYSFVLAHSVTKSCVYILYTYREVLIAQDFVRLRNFKLNCLYLFRLLQLLNEPTWGLGVSFISGIQLPNFFHVIYCKGSWLALCCENFSCTNVFWIHYIFVWKICNCITGKKSVVFVFTVDFFWVWTHLRG